MCHPRSFSCAHRRATEQPLKQEMRDRHQKAFSLCLHQVVHPTQVTTKEDRWQLLTARQLQETWIWGHLSAQLWGSLAAMGTRAADGRLRRQDEQPYTRLQVCSLYYAILRYITS